MSLQEEINTKLAQISRDSYQMSIGELMNLYQSDEMNIHPEFQRVFRWTPYQKTRLIESIMLGIPIPPIFVSTDSNGIWDVIDGVQRLSTIFEFVGIFKDEQGTLQSNLTLEKTEYLPSFENVVWNSELEPSFTQEQRLFFKRARFDVIILKKDSDANTKYELFQRLNTGGTALSGQEVRSCMMLMTNKVFYEFVMGLDGVNTFRETVPLTDRKTDEKYRVELVLRLLIANFIDWNRLSNYTDFTQLLDKETMILCQQDIDYNVIKEQFSKTFELLNNLFGEDSFRKYNGSKHVGPTLATAFQGIALGVFHNIDAIRQTNNYEKTLKDKIHAFYSQEVFTRNMLQGVRAIPRYKELSNFGKDYFKL